MENYSCHICGKTGVKLWRPYGNDEPLICACCAEERQTPREFEENIWERKNGNTYIGKPTGRMIPMEKWTIDETGRIPSPFGPGPTEEEPLEMTNQLVVNIKGISEYCQADETTLIPALPTDYDSKQFWSYFDAPEDDWNWWTNLPTR